MFKCGPRLHLNAWSACMSRAVALYLAFHALSYGLRSPVPLSMDVWARAEMAIGARGRSSSSLRLANTCLLRLDLRPSTARLMDQRLDFSRRTSFLYSRVFCYRRMCNIDMKAPSNRKRKAQPSYENQSQGLASLHPQHIRAAISNLDRNITSTFKPTPTLRPLQATSTPSLIRLRLSEAQGMSVSSPTEIMFAPTSVGPFPGIFHSPLDWLFSSY